MNTSNTDFEIPHKWFNVVPYLPEPLPPLRDPDDDKGSRIEAMKAIRLQTLKDQDESKEDLIKIPDSVREHYQLIGRPTPLFRAKNLERYLKTPAQIYFKREDLLPTGSFKLNSEAVKKLKNSFFYEV